MKKSWRSKIPTEIHTGTRLNNASEILKRLDFYIQYVIRILYIYIYTYMTECVFVCVVQKICFFNELCWDWMFSSYGLLDIHRWIACLMTFLYWVVDLILCRKWLKLRRCYQSKPLRSLNRLKNMKDSSTRCVGINGYLHSTIFKGILLFSHALVPYMLKFVQKWLDFFFQLCWLYL